jgi:hypothetical protein
VLYIESSSSVNPPCVGIDIPVDGCQRCVKEGYKLFDKAAKQGNFSTVQMTDRVNKKYERHSR